MKTALLASILALAPGLAFAQCGHQSAAMTCATGTTYDAEKGACVPVTG